MKIAISQLQCSDEDRQARIARDAALAAQSGCDILVLPELVLPGYNRPEDHEALAQTATGSWAAFIRHIAQQNGLAIVYGWAERTENGVYNAASVITDHADRIAHYRKIQLFGPMEHSSFSAGHDAPPVFTFRGRTFGLLICYDIEFPEHARALARRGAEVILVPTANPSGFEHVPDLLVPARAYENRAVVAYANYSGEENGLSFGGFSVICGPDGRALAKADQGDALLIAEINDDLFEGAHLSTQIADLRDSQTG